MAMFTLATSCLTASSLPWFMDLTFQVAMQFCSLQHRALLLSPVTSTTGCCFCFGSISSFFLELFLHWSPVAYWAPTNLGSSSFSVLSFCLFILFMAFSRQEYWMVCHSLLHWTTFCPEVYLGGSASIIIKHVKLLLKFRDCMQTLLVVMLLFFLWNCQSARDCSSKGEGTDWQRKLSLHTYVCL